MKAGNESAHGNHVRNDCTLQHHKGDRLKLGNMRTGSYGTYSELYGAIESILAPANQTELYPTGSKHIFVRTFGV